MIQETRWKQVEFSRTQIIKAGKTIRNNSVSSDEKEVAIEIIDNWRMAHAFPLHIIYTHLRRFKRNRNDIFVAERLKRLDSIIGKLKRENSMNLWTMQDLGGCRVIVPSIEEVYSLAKRYEKSRKRHMKKKEYDYIDNPKQSGYRSLHVVYEYKSDKSTNYNKNMLIEIQFRTHLQHLWATAVETMGMFKKTAIKSGQGDEDINRFFTLTSSLIAMKEETSAVPNTTENISEIKEELIKLNEKNQYLKFLNGIKIVTNVEEKSISKSNYGYCILILNYKTNKLYIKRYKASAIDMANEEYNRLENESKEDGTDVVLVRVSSFSELKNAYPNYFADISEFIDFINKMLD